MEKRVNRVPHIIAGLVLSFATGLLFTWSYFRAPLTELFPTWTSSDLSTIFSLHNATVCVSMFFAGLAAKKLPRRLLFGTSAVLIAIGLGIYAFIPADSPETAFKMALVGFAVIAAFGAGISATCWMGTFVLWVPDHVGLMAGGMLLTYGSCPLVYGALSSVLIPKIGVLNTMTTIGCISAVLIVLALPWARLPRPDEKLPPAPPFRGNKSDRSFTTMQMLKNPGFWAMFLFNISVRSAGLIFADHSADIARSFGAAALFGMLYAPANGSASFVGGLMVDKIGSSKTMTFFGSLLLLSSLILFLSGLVDIMVVALIGLIGAGFAFGGNSSVCSSTVRMLFGSEHYTQNYSVMSVSILFASFICYLAGLLVDAMAGSFNGVYALTSLCAVAALGCTFALSRYIRKEERRTAEAEATSAEQ